MQNDIAKQRATLDRTNDLGKVLIENSSENPLVVADVQGKLTKVRVQLDRLDARIEQRHAILQNILLQIQVYEVMIEELFFKLGEMENEVANFRPISALLKIVSEQKEYVKHSVSENISRKQPVFEKILEDGHSMLEKMEPGSERDIQQEKLEKMRSRWNDIKDKVGGLQKFVEEVHEASQKYDHRAAAFRFWLEDAEKKLGRIYPVSCDENELNETLKKLVAVASDIEAHMDDFRELDESAASLTSICQADSDVIKADFNELKSRWEALQVRAHEKQAKLQEAKEAFIKYQSALQPVQEAFTQAEDALVTHEPAGTDVDKLRKELEQIKALVSTLDERKGDIKQINRSGQQLLHQAEDDAPSTFKVKEQLDNVNSKAKDMPQRLTDRQNELEKILENTLKFNSILEEIERWLPEAVETFDALEPVSSESEKLQEQIRETGKLEEEVKLYLVRVCEVESTGQRLIEESMENPDAASDVQIKIEKAREPVHQLNAQLEQRRRRLHEAVLQSQEFHDAHDDFVARLGVIEEALKSQKPISPDYPTTKRQKDEAHDLNDSISQMQPALEKLLVKGEKVLKVTDDGEDADALRQKLDSLKEAWENVKSIAADRESNVSLVIPLAKSFYTESHGFGLWLGETEKKVATINTDSVNPEELNLQQKALEELKQAIERHTPDHASLNSLANSLKDKCKNDHFFVDVQQKDINLRWEELMKETESKSNELNFAKTNLDGYLDALSTVEYVVQSAETRLECQEPTALDVSKSKEELLTVQQIVQELENCEPRLREVQHLGGNLLQGMSSDSVETMALKQQLTKVDNWFAKTLMRVRNRQTQLQAISVLIIEFKEKCELVMTWTEEINAVLETIRVVGVKPIVVKSQLEEMEHIQEDIVKHKFILESAGDAGQRLVECSDNEPAILMEVNSLVYKGKAALDLLSAKVDEQQSKLQAAVLQSQEFQETMDDFTSRLGEFEDDVAKMGSVSSLYDVLREQSKAIEQATAEVKQLEPLFERITRNGQDILDSLDLGEEKDEMKEKLNDLTVRWSTVKLNIEGRKAKIDDVSPAVKTHHSAMQSLLPWMTETEDWVSSLEPVSCDEKCLLREQNTLVTLLEQLAEHKGEVVF